ncbi:MAG: hypothetical protein M3063_12655 [Actinomycetota bacterium]|nr:hypothetical protein [Actinomycetota bacterium]
MSTRTHRRLAATALIGGLALAASACGSSSKTSTPTTASGGASSPSSAGTTSDKVTALPNLMGMGTTVTLNPQTAAALTSLKVTVTPFGQAMAAKTASGGTAVTFPITGGYAEIHSDTSHQPGYILGSIQHYNSGLTFTGGGKTLTVSDFVVDPANSMLYATVGGKPKIPLLTLDGTAVKAGMSGSDVTLDGTVAKLTQTAASALDSTFGTTAVTAGLPLGTVHLDLAGTPNTYSDKTTEISRLSGQSTSVSLDAGTAMALKGLGVAVAPQGTATFDTATSTIGFPITGGFAAIHTNKSYQPGYIAGVLIHQGSGITFSAGGKTLSITDFVVDPGSSTLTGTVGGKVGVPIASLNGTPVQVSMVGSTVHLDGTIVNLTQTAAGALNTTFGTTAVKAGLPLGVAHIIVAGS